MSEKIQNRFPDTIGWTHSYEFGRRLRIAAAFRMERCFNTFLKGKAAKAGIENPAYVTIKEKDLSAPIQKLPFHDCENETRKQLYPSIFKDDGNEHTEAMFFVLIGTYFVVSVVRVKDIDALYDKTGTKRAHIPVFIYELRKGGFNLVSHPPKHRNY